MQMSVFKEEAEIKRVIFNVRLDLAERLEQAKADSRELGKKLDVDSAVDKALEKFLKKAERKIVEIKEKNQDTDAAPTPMEGDGDANPDTSLEGTQ